MSATDALMVRAPRDSGLASFLRLFNRDPSAIKLVTLEHLIIKYISFFRLRDPTNPSMIWGNVNLTNSLSGNRVFHASQLRGILCGIVDPVDGLTVQQVKGTSTIFGDWIQAGDSFFFFKWVVFTFTWDLGQLSHYWKSKVPTYKKEKKPYEILTKR